jgi:hypothetical protein
LQPLYKYNMENSNYNLSNFTVKVHLKKNNQISFHLFTYLVFESSVYFESTDLKKYDCHIILKDGTKIEFGKKYYVASPTSYDYSFEGKAKVIELHYSKIMDYILLEDSVIDFEMNFKFKEYNYIPEKTHSIKSFGILKKMYDERSFE